MLTNYIALLRGINVGGKNKLPMKDLAGLCTEAGCSDVRWYIQSGNVFFQADTGSADQLPQKITTLIAERFGYRIPIVLRTAEELGAAARNNPFLQRGVPEESLHVLFLADLPHLEKVAGLDPHRSSPDAFSVQGREIYLHLPHGVADTKLTNAYFDSKLATICTSRNWKTVTALLSLMTR